MQCRKRHSDPIAPVSRNGFSDGRTSEEFPKRKHHLGRELKEAAQQVCRVTQSKDVRVALLSTKQARRRQANKQARTERLTPTAYDDVDERYLLREPLYLITGKRNFHRSLNCTDCDYDFAAA